MPRGVGMRFVIDSDRAPTSTVGTTFEPPQAVDGWHRLSLVPDLQSAENWCWAAIAASVARHYGAAPADQNEIAARLTGSLDREARLDAALRLTGCFGHWSPGKPLFDRVRFEINAGRPFAARIAWHQGAGHYVLVTGYHADGTLQIDDPATGQSVAPYSGFPERYRSGGGWTETFWTTPLIAGRRT